MIIFDANVLIYSYDLSSPWNSSSRVLVEEKLSGNETVGFAWATILAFIRISTNPRIMSNPLSPEKALEIVSSWLEQPNSVIIAPGGRHLEILKELLLPIGTAANLTSDAHLAALAIEHGATLYSFDTDFIRFSGLQFMQPS